MSITAYTGLPGSGKSYSMFEHVIIPALKKHREVWTNIPFNKDICLEEFGCAPVLFEMDDIKNNTEWFQNVLPKGVICVLDEVWQLWPSGLKTNLVPEGYKIFLAQHRHIVCEKGISTEVIIGTQDLSQVSAFARDLVAQTFRSVKLTAIGSKKRFRIDCYEGPVSGPNPPKSKLINQFTGKYKPHIYRFYQSHTMSDTGLAGDEAKSDDRTNILKSAILPISLTLVFLLIVLTYFGASQVFRAFSNDEEEKPVIKETKENAITQKNNAAMLDMLKRTKVIENSIPDLLENREIEIYYNIGRAPKIEYVFKITRGDEYYTLDNAEVRNLGYRLRPINNCLAIITSRTSRYIASCKKSDSGSIIDLNLGSKSDEQDT